MSDEPQKAVVFPYAWATAIGPQSVIEEIVVRGSEDGSGHAAYLFALAQAGAVRIVSATRVDTIDGFATPKLVLKTTEAPK
jgi:hypothetical protein